MKALIVDPDPERAPALAQVLQASGAEVAIATNALFVLTMLEWNKQDVIISRARLGDMEGHELCAIVRADPSTKDMRFVLVVGPGESAPAETAAAGVDLLLPDALSGATMVTRIVELVRRQSDATRPAAPRSLFTQPRPVAPAPTPPVARPKPRSIAPAPSVAPSDAAPPIAPPPKRVAAAGSRPGAPGRPTVPIENTAPIVTPSPAPPAAAAPAPVAPAAGARAPSMAGLDAVGTTGGARTFQGALGVLEIEELTQAIAVGGKTGRLVLVLTTGGGLVVFEGGRVTHAEYGGEAGEAAFSALVAASHRERGGKFCFIPVPPSELRSQPKTIERGVDQLLLDVARTMDEEKRA